jgi:hypothetical protein
MLKLFGTSLLYLKAMVWRATQTLKKSRSHAKVIWHIFIIFEGNGMLNLLLRYGMLDFFWQVIYKTVGTMASWLGTFVRAKFKTIILFVKTSSDFSSVFREHIAKCKNLRGILENELAMWYFLMIPSRSLPYTYPPGNMRKKIKNPSWVFMHGKALNSKF